MQTLILGIFLVSFLAGPPSKNAPEEAVKNFYSAVLAMPERAGVPNENALRRLAPFMSKGLTDLFRDALARREQFIKDHPPKRSKEGYLIQEKPPFIDGDFFSSNFEGATKFKIGKTSKSGGQYRIDLHLEYTDAAIAAKPFAWTDAIYVIEEDGRFVVDDIEFLGDWPFGCHGLLSKVLRAR